jgi:hypothetical protein
MVMVHLNGSVVGSMLKAQRTVLELLPLTSEPIYHGTHLLHKLKVLGSSGVLDSLYAQTRDILGETYLTALRSERIDGAISLAVRHQDTQMIQYGVSSFGLKAIRIIYMDESKSQWLGDPSDCWLGILPVKDLGKLVTLSDVSV